MVVFIKGEGGKQGPYGVNGFAGPRGQSDTITPLRFLYQAVVNPSCTSHGGLS